MNKRNKKSSRVEVVEPVSVVNICDYQRDNGKCGRALCDNFGKQCTGRACEDWKCDAEGEEPESDGAPSCKHYSDPYGYCVSEKSEHFSHTCHKCKVFEDKWFCGELRCNGTCGNGKSGNHNKKCRGENCPDLIPTNSTAVAVVEPRGGAVGMTEQDIAAGISRQCAIIKSAEENAARERVKLGVVLIRWEQYLGESRGGNHDKNGLKGWLEANVPELNYNTAMNYKHQAEKAITMLGNGAQAQAALMGEPTVTQPDGEVIDVEAKYVEEAEKIFESADSRRKFEQQYFEFMAKQGKKRQGGANKGRSGTGRRALTPVEKAEDADVEIRQLIGKIIAFDKGEKFRMLTAQTQSDIILALKDVVKSFEEQQA